MNLFNRASPYLKPANEIQTKISAAIVKLKTLHNMDEWQDEETVANSDYGHKFPYRF